MTRKNTLTEIASNPSCIDDYDPNSMSVAQAKTFIRDFLTPVTSTEVIPLTESLDRVLANAIISPANVPNYDNAAMDGYALACKGLGYSEDTRLTLIGTAFAGNAFDGEVKAGECVRIMTGGFMPKGADCVVMQEKVMVHSVGASQQVQLLMPPSPGLNVRLAGEDLSLGQTVLSPGHRIRAADLGLIASLGIGQVMVYTKLKVAFFSTGDELAALDETLQLGQVYDSNRYSLYGMLQRLNVDIIDLGRVPDDPNRLEDTLLRAANIADVVITTGGVSVGEADYMKSLLAKHGEVVFWKIAMKPGRPLAFGQLKKVDARDASYALNPISQTHYFGLPGNPVAVMVTFYQFVREALLICMGQPHAAPLPTFQVTCVAPIKKMVGRTEYQRGVLFADDDGCWKVKPTGAQGSAILSSMSRANCFIVLDEEIGNLEANTIVRVQVMDGIV